jgi:ABC-2 type transport system permease protein
MLRSVFTKSLWDQRRGLLGWAIGVVLIEAALWPTLGDVGDIKALIENYPEPLRKLFNLDEFASGQGFLNVELYSLMLPILFIVFAIGRGARAIAGEEEAGTLDVLLVTPVSPSRLILQQAAALVVAVSMLGAVLLATVLACSLAFGLGIGVGAATTGSLAMILLGTEFGCLALAVGAVTGRRAAAHRRRRHRGPGRLPVLRNRPARRLRPPLAAPLPFHQAVTGGPGRRPTPRLRLDAPRGRRRHRRRHPRLRTPRRRRALVSRV